MSELQTVVIYHAGCFDGFCAAWLMYQVFPDAEFVPAQYGQDQPDVSGKRVFIVDFSYKRSVMLDLIQQCRGRLVVLDHHKTAQAELDGITLECYRDVLDELPYVLFDMDKSGGRLAWEYLCAFHQVVDKIKGCGYWLHKAPWLVDYTEDRDLWRHALPDTHEINATLRSFEFNFELWNEWIVNPEQTMDEFLVVGRGILRAKQIIVNLLVAKAYQMELGGVMVPVVNATCYASEVAAELAKGKPFAGVYFVQGNQRVWSLRSDENGMDVSAIAKTHGGGGHEHSAGFQERLSQ